MPFPVILQPSSKITFFIFLHDQNALSPVIFTLPNLTSSNNFKLKKALSPISIPLSGRTSLSINIPKAASEPIEVQEAGISNVPIKGLLCNALFSSDLILCGNLMLQTADGIILAEIVSMSVSSKSNSYVLFMVFIIAQSSSFNCPKSFKRRVVSICAP